ncbi:hypothetical protein F9L00_24850 [Brucella anthropi]|uniref:hypothetical protein n=2 Tax=Brucella anthropi TaxID=529 RepID=UPI00124CC336|nr:hypothetical protein [Brucella anthropi]KAB2773232.1 hypothetical protein F9L00_24850 [Brucella anthropi]
MDLKSFDTEHVPALLRTAFAAESEKSPRVTLFSNFESDYCKLFRFETRRRQIEITCLHIVRADRPAISNSRLPIHLQTAFHEVMGGEQTKSMRRLCPIDFGFALELLRFRSFDE